MRVLFWSETFWPRVGGVENLAARLLPALQGRGYEFVVVTWDHVERPDEIRYQDIPVYRFPFFSGGRQGNLGPMLENRGCVAQLKKEFAPDLVHVNSYGSSVLFHMNTAAAHAAPMLVSLHQSLPDGPVGRETLLGKLLRDADWVTACSEFVLNNVRDLVPEIGQRSSIIYNATEQPSCPSGRSEPESPVAILCLGRLVREKGFDIALAAFARIRGRFPELRLIVAGDGPEKARLEQQAAELSIADVVRFTGWIAPEAVADLMNSSAMLVVPSRWQEPFGLIAIEAAFLAKPIVAARVGGLPEIIEHEQSGLLIDPENSSALADAIVYLVTHPDAARRLGEAARSRAQRLFAWERYVDAHDALYRKLVSDWRPPPLPPAGGRSYE
jgi:glycogen(starch) synthase